MSVHYSEMQITFCGVEFIVTGDYTPSDPGDNMNPFTPEEFEISEVRLVGQPKADAYELLNAIHLRGLDGHALLVHEVLSKIGESA